MGMMISDGPDALARFRGGLAACLVHSALAAGRPRLRRLRVEGRWRTVRLEDELWEAFDEIANLEGQTADDLADLVDAARADGVTLTAALRIFIAHYLMSRCLRS